MKYFILIFIIQGFLLSASHAKEENSLKIPIARVYEKIETNRPIQIVTNPLSNDQQLLVLQEGKVLMLSSNTSSEKCEVFLDLTHLDLIDNAFEEGLLGLTFHPDYAQNGLFYLYYTLQNPKRSVLVERKLLNFKKLKVDDTYSREVISIPQPYWNHNSGVPCFGPDGYLYLSTGDGGKANDPHDHSQNTFSLLGKVLRIDVDRRSGDLSYGIPPTNPFVAKPGYREEIWALGLRNPWRIHWDFKQGLLFCADVGQHLWEEVNLIEKGGNYGWNIREGNHPFPGNLNSINTQIETIPPIFEYGHDLGTSISGGCTYYGEKHPQLSGKYIFGDWGTGKTWALEINDEGQSITTDISFESNGQIINPLATFKKGKPQSPFKPVNFCMGIDGQMFILDWQGYIYRTI